MGYYAAGGYYRAGGFFSHLFKSVSHIVAPVFHQALSAAVPALASFIPGGSIALQALSGLGGASSVGEPAMAAAVEASTEGTPGHQAAASAGYLPQRGPHRRGRGRRGRRLARYRRRY